MSCKKIKKSFPIVWIAYAVSALSVLLIPSGVTKTGELTVTGYLAGSLFWTGLLAGSVMYVLLLRKAKQSGTLDRRGLPGFLRFFSNPTAKVTDTVMLAGLVGSVICLPNGAVPQPVSAGFLLLLVAGIYAHIVFNGKIYHTYWNNTDQKRKPVK